MCGIVGALSNAAFVRQDLYNGLITLQHRGQDAAGIMTYSDDGQFHLRKSHGLVREVILKKHMEKLTGRMGIGHVRYPTSGLKETSESQPFYVNAPYGLGVVHNGNLTNTTELRDELVNKDLRHLNTKSDSEILLNICAHELQLAGTRNLTADNIFKAISEVYKRLQGSYSVLLMINGYGLVAFRDPHGVRPLVFGRRTSIDGVCDYYIASESVALDALGFEMIRDVAPGEAIYFPLSGAVEFRQCVAPKEFKPCIFEYIYLARPDSILDNIAIYQARIAMGKSLAKKMRELGVMQDVDVIIPIPDTSRNTAVAMATELGLHYAEGFVKNRYIGRTFIMPEQAERLSSVQMKLNPIKDEFRDKVVLLIDDSIVRGTTSREIIQLARRSGAKKVYFATAAPPVRFPNIYGIDMPTAAELIAHDKTEQEVGEAIGADYILYSDLDTLKQAILASSKETKVTDFEDSIFSNNYLV
jgi:amidophosphoribosyltransferase